jgi:hypothetical protein
MEDRFGAALGDVKVHTDEAAASAALGAGARALTYGREIAFAEGFYAPSRPEGKRLIAHELAHVIQQSQPHGRKVSAEGAESEARAAGARLVRRELVRLMRRLLFRRRLRQWRKPMA